MTGSHATWAKGLSAHSKFDFCIRSMPGRHWKWRMHGAAVTLAGESNALDVKPLLFLATDMLDVATFKSLLSPELAAIPILLYFHENQLTYPWSGEDQARQWDRNYAFKNFTSALVADGVYFNSGYHKTAFLEALDPFLKAFPDYRELDRIQAIEKKSEILHPGLDLKKLDACKPKKSQNKVPLILWNHRWEYDKNPDAFFHVLFRLADQGLAFELVVLGESHQKQPPIFEEAKKRLSNRIVHWGYARCFETYARWLWQADVLPVTSNQDFFGMATLEAVYAETHPLLPDRLAFPEHFSEGSFQKCAYASDADLEKKLAHLLQHFPDATTLYAKEISHYDWSKQIQRYDALFERWLGNGRKEWLEFNLPIYG